MAVPEVISDQASLIPQKRSASIPDSAPIPKKHNNTTRTIRERSDKKRVDSPEPKDSKSTKSLTEGEVFRRLERVQTEMAIISWYMDLPETLKIPEIPLDFSIPNMSEWPDQDTVDKWWAQRHRKPDEGKKNKQDEGPEDKKEGKNEEAKDEKLKDETTKDDYEDAMQEE